LIGILIAILLAAFVFWLVSHISVILAVIAALLVLLVASPVGAYGDRYRWPRR
jgi:uncharacterized membrane protein YccC